MTVNYVIRTLAYMDIQLTILRLLPTLQRTHENDLKGRS